MPGVFIVKGRRFPIPDQDMTLGEQRIAKHVSGGMSPIEIADRVMVGDPDAIVGLLFVAMRRVDPNVVESDLDELVYGSTLTVETDKPAESEQTDPPVEAGVAE